MRSSWVCFYFFRFSIIEDIFSSFFQILKKKKDSELTFNQCFDSHIIEQTSFLFNRPMKKYKFKGIEDTWKMPSDFLSIPTWRYDNFKKSFEIYIYNGWRWKVETNLFGSVCIFFKLLKNRKRWSNKVETRDKSPKHRKC